MKSYFNYFKIPFIIVAVMIVVTVPVYLKKAKSVSHERGNTVSDNSMAVYDYAGKMTDEEVEKLNDLIQKWSIKSSVDIAVVTLDDAENGYLEKVQDYAYEFTEENQLGFEEPGGAALVFVDNWSRGGDGYIHSWVSTTGDRVRSKLSDEKCEEILNILDEIPDDDADPYPQYEKIVKALGKKVNPVNPPFNIVFCFIAGLVAAVGYIFFNWNSKVGDDMVSSGTYLSGGTTFPVLRDSFRNKVVTKRKIERDKGSSGGSGGGGGGGSHGGGGHSR